MPSHPANPLPEFNALVCDELVAAAIGAVSSPPLHRPPGPNEWLGNAGLGHAPNRRRRYHAEINRRLVAWNRRLNKLTPSSFTEPTLGLVSEVQALVRKDQLP